MGRGRKQGYAPINPNQAVDLGARMITKEQEELAEKLMKRRARNQLAVAFAQAMVHGQTGDFVTSTVVDRAYELASAVLDKSEKLDEDDPIDTSKLAGIQIAQ